MKNIRICSLLLSMLFVCFIPVYAFGQSTAKLNFKPAADFSVITVGTGSPLYSKDRVKPSSVIQYSGNYIVVDSGDGSFIDMEKFGMPQNKITGIFYTHHHLDHNADAIPLIINSRLRGSDALIVGPSEPSTKKLVDFILSFYKDDVIYRCERMGKSYEKFSNIKVKEISKPTEFNIGTVKVTTTNVVHTIPTYAYRFDYAGKSIVISGDTSYSENLIKLSKGADILVMDSGGIKYKNDGKSSKFKKPKLPKKRKKSVKIDNIDISKAHASMKEVAIMAAKSNVKTLVLTHFRPGEVDSAATSKGIGKYYHGKVIFASDMKQYIP
ncbi:MAG: MBL fold metallo-hydrolase [Desulfobacteraceae bacterium]|nr:MBL fold metallo-hydrolase [Desulfobacteraceae bacterium]